MTDFKLAVQIFIVLSWIPSPVSIRTLRFEDGRCGGPHRPRPGDSLQVIHSGEVESSFCQDMTFDGWDAEDRVRREVCVRVTDLQLDCSQVLEYRVAINRGDPTKSYGCERSPNTMSEFCTFELLYIRIKQFSPPQKNTQVKYTVYSGAEKEKEDGDFPIFSVIAPLFVVVVVIVIIGLVYYKRRRRQNQGPSPTQNPNQHPQANVNHYYHPVYQTQAQGQPYPTQGYNAPPQQNQGYNAPPQQNQGYYAPPQLNQGHNAPPQPNQGYYAPPQQTQGYSGPPQQFQTNIHPSAPPTFPCPPGQEIPSAPVAYPYAPGQEIYPPQIPAVAQQQTDDLGEPPSYEEVTKRKT